jgi:hypothetical protein
MGLRTAIKRSLARDFHPIFLAGVTGSGTTLLSGLLDRHFRRCACLHESARQSRPDSPLYERLCDLGHKVTFVTYGRPDDRKYLPAGSKIQVLSRPPENGWRLFWPVPSLPALPKPPTG